jgi:hypothetical protein
MVPIVVHAVPGLRRAFPTCITMAGLLVGLAGVAYWGSLVAIVALAVSLALDVADGYAARTFDAETKSAPRSTGRRTCRSVGALAWRVFPPSIAVLLSCMLVAIQVASQVGAIGRRASGRAFVFALAASSWAVGAC